MYDRKILTLKAIKVLISENNASISRISTMTDVGRDTLSRELDTLLDMGILCRKSGRYSIESSLCVLILKVSEQEAELIAWNAAQGIFERCKIPFSYATAIESNVALSCATLNTYRRALLEQGKLAVCCLMYNNAVTQSYSLFDIFCVADSEEEILARALASTERGDCLFISDRCFMCADGKSVTRSMPAPKDICAYLEKLFECVMPRRVVVEGAVSNEMSLLCHRHGAVCEFIEKKDGPMLCEREMIAEGITEFALGKKKK